MKLPAVLTAVSLCTLAHAAIPDAITPYPPNWPHRAPWKLNRELLLPETERIEFVVDVPRGAQPTVEALEQLVALASKYGDRPASWVRLGDPRAPQIKWIEPPVHKRSALDEHDDRGDDVETRRYLNEIPSCPAGALPTNVSYVFVRYVGYVGSEYGATGVVVSDVSCGARNFPVIRIAQTRIALKRAPGIDQAFLELRAVAHEYGHVLGLATNPAHGRWLSIVPYRGGAHCIHRDCAVSAPTAMALLKGQMSDYCAACQRDIEQAREHWRTGKGFEEVARLPQPDPVAAVAELKNYNFREGGLGETLVGYGKAVMPALVARMPKLPGGNPASPRSCAVRVALRIVVAEDGSRRPSGTPDQIIPDIVAGDGSAAFLSWWNHEFERFMGGDEWSLPSMLAPPDK